MIRISERLLTAVVTLLDDHRLLHMSKQSKKNGKPAAARDIAERVLALAKANNRSNID